MKTFIFGQSVQKRNIVAYQFGGTGPKILILGAVHGNEPEGYSLSNLLLGEFLKQFDFKLNLTIVPALNIDGLLSQTRTNANGVDLNRNLPTKDWQSIALNPKYPPGPFPMSEPENQALVNYLNLHQPRMIFNLHSWYPLLNVNGPCSPEAEILHRFTGYRIEPTIGYPTPGCLGTYCGIENNMPTLTYELERGLSMSDINRIHVPAMIEALKASQERI